MKLPVLRRCLAAMGCAAFAAGIACIGAAAQPAGAPLTEAIVRDRLAGLEVKPSTNRRGWLVIGTFREPELQLRGAGFQLALYWNGIDDQDWPATRLVEVLAAATCGPVRYGIMEGLLTRLYQARSLIPERDLGGNGGSTFKKRLDEALGDCRVEIVAEGARWHILTVTVRR